MFAVIIDLVGSKKLSVEERKSMNKKVRDILKQLTKNFKEFCIAKPSLTQGDSIELLINHWKPVVYLFHRLLILKLNFAAGFGTGEIHVLREFADECDGPAFWNAREALEKIKEIKRERIIANLKVSSNTSKENIEYILDAILFLTVLKQFSQPQLEYAYYYLWEDMTVSKIAQLTNTSKGNVSKVLSRGEVYTLKRVIDFST
ncbi:MAG: SatD family protein [Candidatus Asgardarchaeia archaeon]